MRRFFAFLFLFLNIVPVFASQTIVTRYPYYQNSFMHSPYYNNYYNQENRFRHQYYPPSPRYSVNHNLNALEKYTFNRNYIGDSNLARLERLERQAFGTVQSGDIASRFQNVQNAILSRPKVNYQKSFLRNIGDFFAGQMTGYTPSFDNQNFWNSDFGRKSAIQYSSPYGSGYRTNDYSTGSSTGIRILD